MTVTLRVVPRELAPIRTEYELVASRLRTRAEAASGYYHPELVRLRVNAAVCDECSIDREEHVESVTSTVLSKVAPCL